VPQWEYRTIELTDSYGRGDDIAVLNKAGSEGWELVRITVNNIAYLKRVLEQPAETKSRCGGAAH
jgi:Domain of unknown function (DUF4177)